MTSYEEALALILAETPLLPLQRVALEDGLGAALAEPVRAPLDLPPFDNSAVDGYAVRNPILGPLTLIDEAPAGHDGELRVGPGEAIRIFTGAPLPDGADAVVMQEDVSVREGLVLVNNPPAPGAHIRRQGEEVRAGDEVLPAGYEVTPATLGVLSTLGLDKVGVRRAPRALVVTTGNELVSPGQPLARGQVYASNGVALSAALRSMGAFATVRHVRDDPDATREALREGLDGYDLVLTAGGVSVGGYDFVRGAWESLGLRERFWRVAIKPGKPVLFGVVPEGPLVFGLPGNPVSALVTFFLFVRPALRTMTGRSVDAPDMVTVGTPLCAAPGRDEFVRVRMTGGVANPLERQGSHMASGLALADALVRVPAGATLRPGDRAEALPLRWH